MDDDRYDSDSDFEFRNDYRHQQFRSRCELGFNVSMLILDSSRAFWQT